MIGKSISHYTILEKLGKGGMGEVFLAEDNKLHRKVALKFLFKNLCEDPETKARFEREAQTAAALNHPNIVVVHEIDEFEGQIYISMEYVEGESLRYHINKKQFSISQAIEIILQICQGLSKAHQAGIVHRDIKPENIMIDRDGRLKILDFGLAKLKGITGLTRNGTKMGTAHYMSPEQARGEDVDQRSDIFALGAILYELLSERFAFKGDYDLAVIYAIVHEQPQPLTNVPEELQQIVDKALKKNPAQRYSTLRAMITELQEIRHNLEMSEKQSMVKEVPPKYSVDLAAGVENIEDLLQQRQKIDDLIISKYTKNVTIMLSDVVGSTAYFEQRGDVSGRAMLQRYTRFMVPIIEKHGGKMIKTVGDAILAYFPDPVNGCRCGIEMQSALREDNATQLEEDRISIRIALHFGKVVIEKEDVFGDIVNVAAQVEQRAQANEILLSHTVYDQIKDISEFFVVFVGKESLKGKSEQIELYRLLWEDKEMESQKIFKKGEYDSTQLADLQASSLESKREISTVKILKAFDIEIPQEKKDEVLPIELKNPYMNRVMIKNINEFYGRKSEVLKIYSRIGSSRPQSVSIVGERRIGKSSLLNYIYHPKNRMKYLHSPNDYLFIFIDFQEKRGINIPQFFDSIYAFLLREFKGGLVLDVKPNYEGFKKVITTFDQNGLNIIMLFDEFESITKNQNFNTEFYSFLRSIANNYNIAYVVSSGRNLQNLCHSREISDSPFFNIFSNITVTQFSREEALQLITQPSYKLGYSLEHYAPFVFDIAGYYPFFIQIACAVLFEYVRKNDNMTKTTLDKVKEEFLDEAKVHFQQIWDICDDDQREVLLRLCHGEQIPKSQEYVLNKLIKAGYVKVQNERSLIFSSLFEKFIAERYGAKMEGKKKKKFLFWSI